MQSVIDPGDPSQHFGVRRSVHGFGRNQLFNSQPSRFRRAFVQASKPDASPLAVGTDRKIDPPRSTVLEKTCHDGYSTSIANIKDTHFLFNNQITSWRQEISIPMNG